ncbi:MAG: glycosyltransferase [Candidatus Doudnabacteria bacterium]|nr:glycosyltransferase [Candidatus Doudnabacteria bacterium]
MKKALLIDGQVFQSAAWHRGMGKYSLALLQYLLQNRNYSYSKTMIIFNSSLPLEEEAIIAIKNALPDANQIFLDLKIPNDPAKVDIPLMQTENREILEKNISSKLGVTEYDFLILALFIDQVCSVFPKTSHTNLLVFYDLIPLQYIERYKGLSAFPNYLKRFTELFKADVLWAISQTVADDLVINLGISASKVVNIDGAPIQRKDITNKKPKLKLPERYLLMPSGNELRKNNLRAVQGFEQYRRKTGDDIKLVLSSYFDEGTKSQLMAESDSIIFSGNVSEAELAWMYQHAEALLFVPEYEGLGLPILEAVEVNLPIICSNIGVFNEIATDAFFYCDYLDSSSICTAIETALSADDEALLIKLSEYKAILQRYSWPQTAQKALASLSRRATKKTSNNRMKLAVLGPNPAGYSAIGKLVVQMHPSLSEHFDIDYYLESAKTSHSLPRVEYLSSIANVCDASMFTKKTYKKYDAVLYHIGNSEFHVETIRSGLYLPGHAIIHDTHLGNIFEGELLAHNYISKQRYEQETILGNDIDGRGASFLCSLVSRQISLIAHSGYATDVIRTQIINHRAQVAQASLPVPAPKRLTLKKQDEKFTIGFAGIIHPAKGLHVIERIAQDDTFSSCNIHIFGMSLVPNETLDRLRAYPNVTVDINVTDFEFQMMLRRLDVLVNYRKEYRGEASAATLEAMRFGVIPIVTKIGWYDELPDTVALKAGTEDEVIERILEYIRTSFPDRQKRANAARAYVEEQHSYEEYAKNLHELISGKNNGTLNSVIAKAIKSGISKKKLLKIISDLNSA